MSQQALVAFLENIIGNSSKGSKGNLRFSCPFSGCANRPSKLAGEKKLEVHIEGIEDTGKVAHPYHCWSCGTKGKSIYSLLKTINASEHHFTELNTIVKYSDFTSTKSSNKDSFNYRLPQEAKSFLEDIKTTEIGMRHAKVYLKKRGINTEDILSRNITYCDEGEYNGRIVVPSYDINVKMNQMVGRTIHEEVKPKYKYPDVTKDIIPFESHINWDRPIVIVEGVFDMLAVKRNCIPLLGKDIQPELMTKMLTAKNKKYFIALDSDAMKEAIKHCETLMSSGKIVYLVELDGKDPSEMGFEAFTRLVQKATKLTTNRLLKLKIQHK